MKSLDTVIGVAATSKVRESATLLIRSVGNKKHLGIPSNFKSCYQVF
jgi:hypothetical protein